MTENYVSAHFAGISRFNGTDFFYLKRTLKMFLFCAAGLAAGIVLASLFPCSETELKALGNAHFCTFFDGLSAIRCVKNAVRFALADMLSVIITAFFGFTMLACGCSAVMLIFRGAQFGYCFCSLLPLSHMMTGGARALALFALAKLLILAALVFAASEAEGFSYFFRDSYGKRPRTLKGIIPLRYAVMSASTAGFTVLVNTLYLLFIHFQDISML